ncbi:MAG: LytR cell envelope-related transcriptional attenuator [Gaiellaceae bacterium]|nr:LytR cell envelope-related transcriptional attenuator [Gaiellaceae bacterium]
MEQTYTIYRAHDFSRLRVAPSHARLIAIARLAAIALVTIGGWTLIHRVGTPAAAQSHEAPLKPRYAASVLVLNGSGKSGAAGALADRLLARGYRTASAADAQVTTYASSIILFRGGWSGEAARLAQDLGIRRVAPIDGSFPVGVPRYPLVAILGG